MPPSSRIIRIATRSSPMALAQAEQVARDLAGLGHGSELVKVTSAGDRWMGDLSKLGGKGAFVKEIDDALLRGDADLAVHCLKDIPGYYRGKSRVRIGSCPVQGGSCVSPLMAIG